MSDSLNCGSILVNQTKNVPLVWYQGHHLPLSEVFQKQSLLPTEILISPCLLENKTNVCVQSSTKYLYRSCHEKAIKDGGRFRKKFAVVISIVYLDNALRCSDLVCGKGQRSLLRSFCKNTCPGFITEWIQNIVSVEIDFDRTLQRDWRTECISISSEPIILSLDQPSRDLIPTPTAYMYTDHIILSFNFYPYTYGSVSAGREKWPFNVIFFLK